MEITSLKFLAGVEQRVAKAIGLLRYVGRHNGPRDGSMHFMVTWRFNTPEVPHKNEVLTALLAEAKRRSWVCPFPDTYVIRVATSEEYALASQQLVSVAQKYPAAFYMIISPPMAGGRYTGWLDNPLWPLLNQRTDA